MKSNFNSRLNRLEKRIAPIADKDQLSAFWRMRFAGTSRLISQSRYVLLLNQLAKKKSLSPEKRQKINERIVRVGQAMNSEKKSRCDLNTSDLEEVASAFRCVSMST